MRRKLLIVDLAIQLFAGDVDLGQEGDSTVILSCILAFLLSMILRSISQHITESGD